MSTRSTYRRLLRNRPLTRLLLGEFVSSLGDSMYLVAFVIVVYRETHDPVLLGAIAAARHLPFALLSVPAGVVADRFDRRLVLLVSDLVKGILMVALVWIVATGANVTAMTAVVVTSAVLSTLFWPALGALIPSLVDDERDFGAANSAWAMLDNLAWIVGPTIAGLILATGATTLPFLLNAATFVFMALILWTLPRSTVKPVGGATSRSPGVLSPQSDAKASGATASGNEPPRVTPTSQEPPVNRRAVGGVLLLGGAAAFAGAAINISIVLLVVDVFHATDDATGFLNSAVGLGGTLGALVSGVVVLRPRLGRPLFVAAGAMSAAVFALGLAPTVLFAFVVITLASAAGLVLEVLRTTALQRLVTDAYRGRFTGMLVSVSQAAELGGTVLVPVLVVALGAAAALGVVAAVLLLGGLLGVAVIGRAGDAGPGP